MDGVVVLLGPGDGAPECLHVVLREHLPSLNELPWKWYLELQQLRREGTIALQSLWNTERVRVVDRSRSERLRDGSVHLHLELRPVIAGQTAFPEEEMTTRPSLVAEPSHTRIRRRATDASDAIDASRETDSGEPTNEESLTESDRRTFRRA